MTETAYHIQGAPRIALVSDLHGRPGGKALASIRKNRPEIICITGDIIYGPFPEDDVSPLVSQEQVLPFLSACAGIAPTYLSLGNHEQALDAEDIAEIGKTGVTMLDNSWERRDGLVIGGWTSAYVTDYRRAKPTDSGRRYPRPEHHEPIRTPESGWLEAYVREKGYHILLSHHPEYYPMLPEGVELMLSGHAHGGQIRLFGRGLFAPGQGWFPQLTKGVYDGRLVVSAGLANTGAPVPRLFNPTEMVYVINS